MDSLECCVYFHSICLLSSIYRKSFLCAILKFWYVRGHNRIYGVLSASGTWYNLQEYYYISSKRISYFYASKPQAHQFSLLVTSIPVSSGSSVTESVESFFTEYHSATYLSHSVVRQTGKLRRLLVSMEALLFYFIFCGKTADFLTLLGINYCRKLLFNWCIRFYIVAFTTFTLYLLIELPTFRSTKMKNS